jgi:hypothetical protein
MDLSTLEITLLACVIALCLGILGYVYYRGNEDFVHGAYDDLSEDFQRVVDWWSNLDDYIVQAANKELIEVQNAADRVLKYTRGLNQRAMRKVEQVRDRAHEEISRRIKGE